MKPFAEQYREYQEAVEKSLDGLFTQSAPWGELYASMRYSLLAGGKRIRPVMTLAFSRLAGADWRDFLPVACAVEMIHTFSLIHDDLPCMDNDDMRRGRPSNHKAYGETLALLAGDTLSIEAFRLILSAPRLSADVRVECARILAEASGADGMAAGQILDTLHAPATMDDLKQTHRLKTGALIAGSCGMGAAPGDAALSDAASTYGFQLGLAFQIQDDVLDVTANAEELGKPVGSDRESGKITCVDLIGLDASDAMARACTENAVAAVAPYDADGFLTALARSLTGRRR